jgi:hypothetical protein
VLDVDPSQRLDLAGARDLISSVASIAGVRVDVGRDQQANVVVVAQGVDRQPLGAANRFGDEESVGVSAETSVPGARFHHPNQRPRHERFRDF